MKLLLAVGLLFAAASATEAPEPEERVYVVPSIIQGSTTTVEKDGVTVELTVDGGDIVKQGLKITKGINQFPALVNYFGPGVTYGGEPIVVAYSGPSAATTTTTSPGAASAAAYVSLSGAANPAPLVIISDPCSLCKSCMANPDPKPGAKFVCVLESRCPGIASFGNTGDRTIYAKYTDTCSV